MFASNRFFGHIRSTIRTALLGPQLVAFLPALMLGGYWFGGEAVLLFSALIFPALFAIAGLFSRHGDGPTGPREGLTDLQMKKSAIEHLDRLIAQANGRMVVCFALEIDAFETLIRRENARMAEHVLRAVANRLQSALRKDDMVFKFEGPRFGIVAAGLSSADLETLIQIACRLQESIEEPITLDGTKCYQTASVGFAKVTENERMSGSLLVSAAEVALEEALLNGGSGIRAYAPEMRERADRRGALRADVAEALDNGEIRPWFQPQISTETGTVSGMEALARWEHPTRGLVGTSDFLSMIQTMGFAERLSEVMVSASLRALSDWEKAGHVIPTVAVNFSSDELRNPKLPERIQWELDRFDLAPSRLTVEVMETVIADGANDIILRNLAALSKLGCQIDLDDFGTGHASITNIRRFGVDRIKIDRSFVTRVDLDRDQRSLVAAILTMAERLGLDTLAEGVETPGEHTILAQMGCAHIQGFLIARPMPARDLPEWHSKYARARSASDANAPASALDDLLKPPGAAGKTA